MTSTINGIEFDPGFAPFLLLHRKLRKELKKEKVVLRLIIMRCMGVLQI